MSETKKTDTTEGSDSSRCYPAWWPECPYPKSVFPMEIEDVKNLVPNPRIRTSLSGAMGRLFWQIASDSIYRAMDSEGINELVEAAKDVRDNPGTDAHGTVGFCEIENTKLERLRVALESF